MRHRSNITFLDCTAVSVDSRKRYVPDGTVRPATSVPFQITVYIRSDYGPEFTAKAVRKWLAKLGVRTLFIEPDIPWENGYNESFNGTLRDELLNGEIFYTLLEAQMLIERWREHYNRVRPHSALGYRPSAPETREMSVAAQLLQWYEHCGLVITTGSP